MFCASGCRSDAPGFSPIDKTMKKAFWVVFGYFFQKEFLKRTRSKDEVQKDKQSCKIWIKKVKVREQWAKLWFVLRSHHAPLNFQPFSDAFNQPMLTFFPFLVGQQICVFMHMQNVLLLLKAKDPNFLIIIEWPGSKRWNGNLCFSFPFRTSRSSRKFIPFPSIHTTLTPVFLFLQLSDIHRTECVLQYFGASFSVKITAAKSVVFCHTVLRYGDSTMRVQVIDCWSSLSNCSCLL